MSKLLDGFDIQEATQVAYYLIQCKGGQVTLEDFSYLLYLANRKSLVQAGRPLIMDELKYSGNDGPFLWVTTALAERLTHAEFIQATAWSPWLSAKAPGWSYWYEHIHTTQTPEGKVLSLKTQELSLGELSVYIRRLIDWICDHFKDFTGSELKNEVYDLCLEWKRGAKHGYLTFDLGLEDVLMCGTLRRSEIAEVVEQIEHVAYVNKLLGGD